MVYYAEDLVRIAIGEEGYTEKNSADQLFDKYANAGSGNFTKYAFILYQAGYYNGNKQSQPWCDMYVDGCFYVLAGNNKQIAEWLECQTGDCGAGCQYSANYYMQQGRFDRNPKLGDQIFFYADGAINHTGIVIDIQGSTVYTIEGNCGDKVQRRSYNVYDSYIAGFGHPKYGIEYDGSSSSGNSSDEVPIDFDPNNIATYPTLKYGDTGVMVKALQDILTRLGYSVGASGSDGDFGYGTKSAILQLQNRFGLTTDGVVGLNTWALLKKLYDAKNGESENVIPDYNAIPDPDVLGEEDIWYALSQLGFNDYAVAGIMGNMLAESGLRSNNLQDTYEGRLGYTDVSYTVAVDNGTYLNFVNDYAGYGICQWTEAPRKQKLLNHAKSSGKSIADTSMQIDFFNSELKSDFYRAYTKLLNASSVLEASNAMLTEFEKPDGYKTIKLQSYRASLSQEFYDKFRGSGLVTSNPNGLPTLQLGATGSYVYDLQEKLISLGYECGSDGADGEFGENTRNALIRFQEDNGIYADGVCGANTWKLLNNTLDNISSTVSQKPELRVGASGDIVKELQRMLNALGYKCEEDGKFGRQLLAAIMRFQSVSSLFCNGIVNDATWNAIYMLYNKLKDKNK